MKLINCMRMAVCSLAMLVGTSCLQAKDSGKEEAVKAANLSKVYMYKEISADNLVKIYKALGREAKGNVAVKLSTGEPGGHNFLQPELIKNLVQEVNGTIVECNTAYAGKRSSTEDHLKAAEDHGFTKIATVVIMEAEGEA